MRSLRAIPLVLFVLALILLAAGCETRSDGGTAPASPVPVATTAKEPVRHITTALPSVTVPAPETTAVAEITATEATEPVTSRQPVSSHPEYIRMDADTYHPGEIVQFYLVNRGAEIAGCDHARPAYSVYQLFQDGTRRNVAGNLPGISYRAEMTDEPSTSTGPISLNTAGMVPGRYLIRFDCGSNVAREFIISAKIYATET